MAIKTRDIKAANVHIARSLPGCCPDLKGRGLQRRTLLLIDYRTSEKIGVQVHGSWQEMEE
jgi:hypothetical protein